MNNNMLGSIEFRYDDVLLKGIVKQRDQYFIKVKLLSPLEAWENTCYISGMCRQTPDHFLTEAGDKTIKRLLVQSYRKIKMISESIDRLCGVYLNLKSELNAIKEINDIEMRNSIGSKLEDWFFDTIFVSSITGIITSIYDKDFIYEILEDHLAEKKNKKKWKNYGKWLKVVYSKYKNI